MSRNVAREINTKIKSVAINSLAGLLISLLIILLESSLVLSGVLSEKIFSEHGAKIAFFAGVMISTLIIRMRGRGGETKIAIACSFLIWCILALSSFALNNDASILAALACLFVGLLAAFILSIPKNKNSKMHKRRVKH